MALVPALRLDDPDANFGLHVGVEPDGHTVYTKCLDRIVQVDQSLLDVEALSGELLGNLAIAGRCVKRVETHGRRADGSAPVHTVA